jgi:hypothetical protein
MSAPLRLDMPIDDARKLAPDYFSEQGSRLTDPANVRIRAEANAYRSLGAIVLVVPASTALADVIALWGTPVKGYDAIQKSVVYWWFNPTDKLRARLEVSDDAQAPDARLILDKYLPLAELVGNTKEQLGFEDEPIIGMPLANIAKVFGGYMPNAGLANSFNAQDRTGGGCDREVVLLPPVEYDSTFTRILLGCSAGRVRSLEIMIRYANHLALKDEIVADLTRTFGEPRLPVSQSGRVHESGALEFESFGRHLRLRFDEKMKDASLTVRSGHSETP